jgi:4-hydroxythreonine-4-phosphate dehydrogenase
MEKIKIGITIGDINGIGPEVVLKTLKDERILNYCTPIIYGSSKVVSYHKNILEENEAIQYHTVRQADEAIDGKINVLNCWQDNVNITLGKATEVGGKCAFLALEQATKDLRDGAIDALVTAPINKHAMQLAEFPFPGHTEYLTEQLGAGESLMMLVSDALRVALVTNHLPLKDVAKSITKNLIVEKIQILNESLKIDFGIDKPKIAVLGLNPHAGDEGVLGTEEEDIIRPAIIEMKKKGLFVMGPFAADGLFGAQHATKFDAVLAMYHDQGLAPFKALSFSNGINYTAGLGFVRTSPDHGTGYDLVGNNQADPSSFRQALFLAKDIVENRWEYLDDSENALKRTERSSEDVLSKDNELEALAEE